LAGALDEVLQERREAAVHLLELGIVVGEELLEIVVGCWCAVHDVLEDEGELVEEFLRLFAKGEDAVVDGRHVELFQDLGQILRLLLNFSLFCCLGLLGCGEQSVGELVTLCLSDLALALLVFCCGILLFIGLLAELRERKVRGQRPFLSRAIWKRNLVCTVHQRLLCIFADLLLTFLVNDYGGATRKRWWGALRL